MEISRNLEKSRGFRASRLSFRSKRSRRLLFRDRFRLVRLQKSILLAVRTAFTGRKSKKERVEELHMKKSLEIGLPSSLKCYSRHSNETS